jgi:hypothetical protein
MAVPANIRSCAALGMIMAAIELHQFTALPFSHFLTHSGRLAWLCGQPSITARWRGCCTAVGSCVAPKGCASDILNPMEDRSFSDVGGTPGGLGHFLMGLAMACFGAYLLSNQVMVASSYWTFDGVNAFGLTLLPMLIGIGLLFWNGRSAVGWLLTAAGAIFILAGVLVNLHIYFRPTSLFNTIVMLVLLAGGLGLIVRALVPHRR